MNAPIQQNKICAVFSTYYPDDQFEKRVALILPQVGAAVIVNNSSPKFISKSFLDLVNNPTIHIIQNQINEGVAKALNQGVAWGVAHGFEWFLTLDQDTWAEPNLVKTYVEFLSSYNRLSKVGVINSNYKDQRTGFLGFPYSGQADKLWREAPTLITSGSMFSIATYRDVGLFREEFFMDWVDHEYCLRARSKGKRNFVYLQPLLIHSIGEKTAHQLFFFTLPANNHSSFRCFLIGRNLAVLIKEYLLKEFPRVSFYVLFLCYKFFSVMMWEAGKKEKLGMLWQGVCDGILNKMNRHFELLKRDTSEAKA